MNVDWLKRLRRGARLLLWSQVAAYLLVNVFGALSVFFGQPQAYLTWGVLIHTSASLPGLFGVFALSSRGPRDEPGQCLSEPLRLACGGVAAFGWLLHVAWAVSTLVAGDQHRAAWELSSRIVGVLMVVLVLSRMRQLASTLVAAHLARSFLSVTYAYMALALADYVVFALVLGPDGGGADMFCGWALTGLGVVVWIWGLVLLGRFASRIGTVIAGHCGNCEYDLTGNVSGVCPECGTEARALQGA